jgi:parallel beta-helix repeat protein
LDQNLSNNTSKTIYVNINGGADFINIQDAIDHASNGGTIIVKKGIYNEKLIINKSLNLYGENPDMAVIQYENNNLSNSENIVFINADNCTLNGFKIVGTKKSLGIVAIKINSSNNNISNNIILSFFKNIYLYSYTENNTIFLNTISNASYGIDAYNSHSNNISKNLISSCTAYGIYTLGSDNNIFSGNIISDNNYGMRIKGSEFNKVFKNKIFNNTYGTLLCCGARNNMIYYNQFKQNSIYNAKDDVSNQWDNGTVGNFWDDYEKKYPDAINVDGIWNIPYNITGDKNIDRYPVVIFE